MVYKPYAFLGILLLMPYQMVFSSAPSEMHSLRLKARNNIIQFQKNGQMPLALLADFSDARNYNNAKERLSDEQYAVILEAIDALDTAFTIPNPAMRTQKLVQTMRTLEQEIATIQFQSFGAARRTPRTVLKKIKKTGASKKPQSQQFPAGFDDEFLQRMMKNSESSILHYLNDNKWNLLIGAAALYAMYARANDWPPFDHADDNADQEGAPAQPHNFLNSIRNFFVGNQV